MKNSRKIDIRFHFLKAIQFQIETLKVIPYHCAGVIQLLRDFSSSFSMYKQRQYSYRKIFRLEQEVKKKTNFEMETI